MECAGAGAEEDERRIAVWRQGMRALAGLRHVSVKASMLQYTHPHWQQSGSPGHALVRGLVREVSEKGLIVQIYIHRMEGVG